MAFHTPRKQEALTRTVDDWLERYREHWEANFERLDALLEEMQSLALAAPESRPARKPRTRTTRKSRTPRRKS